jgi:RNA polymerase sigma-70 factor (ECF subfamily)
MANQLSQVLRSHLGVQPAVGASAVEQSAPCADPARDALKPSELEQFRLPLTRYARWLLGNEAAAEDAVQETMLAALQSPESFSGRSSMKTWLFGILKHKVADTFRRQSRERPLEDDSDEDARTDNGVLFMDNGHWREPPSNWGDPEAALSQRRFFEVLERCIEQLPKNTARVFTMRELMGMETDAICEAVGISASNCFVMLHRARTILRGLLDEQWFGNAVPGKAGSGQRSGRSSSANL